MNLTVATLKKLNACHEAILWVQANYPDGAEVTPEVFATCDHDDWVCWLACKLSKEYRFYCAGIAFREASKRLPSLEKYAMNVTEDNLQEARQHAQGAAAYDDAAAYAADAAYAAYAADADAAAYAAAAAYAYAYAYAYAAAYAYAYAYAARKRVYSEMRQEAERVLCEME